MGVVSFRTRSGEVVAFNARGARRNPAAVKVTIARRYGVATGNRFAVVMVGSHRVDVRTRVGRTGYELGTAEIKREALDRLGLTEADLKPPTAPKPRRPLPASRRVPAGPLAQLRLFNPSRRQRMRSSHKHQAAARGGGGRSGSSAASMREEARTIVKAAKATKSGLLRRHKLKKQRRAGGGSSMVGRLA